MPGTVFVCLVTANVQGSLWPKLLTRPTVAIVETMEPE